MESTWNEQLEEWWCTVRFGTSIKTVPATDLEALPEHEDPWDAVIQGRVSGAEAFQRLLTFERLRKPPTRISGSFGSAKATFLPYQFKPLLKFLENPSGRLLIADDVGLGKTIEAGYVLRELRARHPLERVLIVVPARLRRKWRDELERRFEEKFEIVGSRELHAFLHRLDNGREPDQFSWIVSYESVRLEPIFEGLRRHEPAIDLIILDEAHRVRNPETNQHRAARSLAGCADSMIFLTATPIQTGVENLFYLLNLLDPDTFVDLGTFTSQLEANRPVIQALAALRGPSPNPGRAKACLLRLQRDPATKTLTEGQFFSSILQRLATSADLSRDDAVRLERDISELSLTAHIMSRTRKADVLFNRPQRRAISWKVPLSPPERRFYEAVAELCRLTGQGTAGWGAEMAALMAYRMTASCIPASVRYFRERLRDGVRSLHAALVRQVLEDDGIADNADPHDRALEPPGASADRIESILAGLAPPPGLDTKYEYFSRALRQIWIDDEQERRSSRKIVVFSYFKRTLDYLSARLAADGVGHRLIYGDVSIRDREDLIEEFATTRDVKVLLSSEVGSEGLDLQVASVVVNYDLPWNPMVVEQRIGRLDRLGQGSPVVTIVNFTASETIEERILLRLYERIGLFEEALGEIDPILGDTVEELARDVLRGGLTREEEERRVVEASRAFTNQAKEAERVSRESDGLIAADQAFLDEIEALFGRRRVPVPEELYRFLSSFILRRYPGSAIPASVISAVGDLHLQPQLATDMQNVLNVDSEARRVAHKILQGPFLATFDIAAILQHPRAELIFIRHPLLAFAVTCMGREVDSLHRAFSLITEGGKEAPKGLYAFSICEFEIGGFRPRTEFVPFFTRLDDGKVLDREQSDQLLVQVLDGARTNEEHQDVPEAVLRRAREGLQGFFQGVLNDLIGRESGLNKARAERRRATLQATLSGRLEAARRRLANLEARRSDVFVIKMARARLEAERRRLETFSAQTAEEEKFRPEYREIATGLLTVRP